MRLNSSKHMAARSLWLFFALAMLGFSSLVNACVICIPYPTKTTADYIADSETVILARENPAKPWSYISVETLKGAAGIFLVDTFLNSMTRRLLKLYPERGVILVRDKKDKTKWRNFGFAREEYEDMIREIIRLTPQWQQQGASSESRVAFFADFLGHENRNIHELSYLEVGRAPYSQIKQFGTRWPLHQIRALLRDPAYFEWYPLAILLLAVNGNESDQSYIIDRFSSLARFGMSPNLAAWTTALIEIQEAAAVVEVEEKYFGSSARSRQELVAVLAAMSEHGSYGHTHLRDQIIQSYSTLLDFHPEMASYVARDLMTWRRRELTDQLAEILKAIEQTDPLNAYGIRLYLGQVKSVNTS